MSTPAPGWYADAVDPALIRWWDGSMWSDHTQPNPAFAPPAPDPLPFAQPMSASAPVPPPFAEPVAASSVASQLPTADAPFVPPTADAAPAQRAVRESSSPSLPISEPVRLVPPTSASLPAGAPTTSALPGAAPASASTPWTSSQSFAQPAASIDLASVDYEPMVRSWGSARSSSSARTVTGVSTSGGWMLAFTPLVNLALFGAGWAITGPTPSASTALVASAFGLVAVLWVVLGAITDYRRLGALGHEFRPSILWILLGPLMYLVARAIHVYRTTGSGVAPTWTYLVLSIVVGAAIAGLSLMAPLAAGLL